MCSANPRPIYDTRRGPWVIRSRGWLWSFRRLSIRGKPEKSGAPRLALSRDVATSCPNSCAAGAAGPWFFFHQADLQARPQSPGQTDQGIELHIGGLALNSGNFRRAHAGAGGELRLIQALLGSKSRDLHPDLQAGQLFLDQLTHERAFHLGSVITIESIHDVSPSSTLIWYTINDKIKMGGRTAVLSHFRNAGGRGWRILSPGNALESNPREAATL